MRIIGLVNFNGYLQLTDYTTASFLSPSNVAPTFAACWLHTMMMFQTIDKNDLKVRRFLDPNRKLWPYITVVILLVGNDWLQSILITQVFSYALAPLIIPSMDCCYLWFRIHTWNYLYYWKHPYFERIEE